jgi:hypothetical protein
MLRDRFGRRGLGVLGGVLAAALPAAASAEEGLRQLNRPTDAETAVLLVALGVLGGFVLASIGFLYRRQRGLRWDYQLPDGALSEGQGRSASEDAH